MAAANLCMCMHEHDLFNFIKHASQASSLHLAHILPIHTLPLLPTQDACTHRSLAGLFLAHR